MCAACCFAGAYRNPSILVQCTTLEQVPVVTVEPQAGGPAGYTLCAGGEGYTCTFTGTRTVAFGANGIFVYKTFTNGVRCLSDNFGGDPLPHVTKACYVASGAAPPPPPQQTPAS